MRTLYNSLERVANENHLAYKNHLRWSTEKYEELLPMIDLKTIKGDAVSRMVVLTITNLGVTVWYLAVGDIFRHLKYLSQIL
jgi:hypothetical protein